MLAILLRGSLYNFRPNSGVLRVQRAKVSQSASLGGNAPFSNGFLVFLGETSNGFGHVFSFLIVSQL
jgi:hypothetical protein